MSHWRSIHWAESVVTAPTIEPVSVTEVKNRLRISNTADDSDLTALIIAARRQVEKDTNASLVSTVWDLTFDRFPQDERYIRLPRWPLVSVTSLTSYDQSDVASVLAASNYLVDIASKPGRLVLNTTAVWPLGAGLRYYNGGVIRYTAGFSGTSKAITSITRSSTTATVTTTAAHGYATGNRITIAGADQAAYNGTFEITVTGGSTYTFTVSGSPTTPATGTITSTDLGIPETYRLAMMVLVGHWWDQVRNGLTAEARAILELPFAYSALVADLGVMSLA